MRKRMCQLRLWRLQPCYWKRVQSLMCYAQHLFVNIAILEKIVQHPELRKGLCTYPTLVCEDCKATTRSFLHMLVKFIGMLLTFDLLLLEQLLESLIHLLRHFAARGGGGEILFCKKKKKIIYISFCTSMPVLASFQIWKHLDAPF